jgi:hypothetical protein
VKSIAKVDTRLQRTAYGGPALVMGVLFTALGVFLALGGFGLIPLGGKANAPLWVIGAIGVAFALSGLLLILHSLRAMLHRRRVANIRRRHLHEPWMLDYPWDPSGVRDAPAERWVSALMGSVLIGAFLVPFNWWAWLSREGNLFVQIITGVFDLLLAILLVTLLYRLLQYAKYGRSRLHFDHFPFAPGEELRVAFQPNRGKRLSVTLRFVEERIERRGRGSGRAMHRSYEHYRETREIDPPERGGEVPIALSIPDQPGWVTRLTADPGVRYWELVVESREPGIDFRTTFPLPVYDRPPSRILRVPRRRAAAAGGRRPIPYAFELALPLAVGGLLGLIWWLAPERVVDGVERVRTLWDGMQTRRMLEPVDGIDASPVDLAPGPDGRLWALTKYSLTRWRGTDREDLMDTRRYRRLFGRKVNALSALLVTGAEEAWLGSWYGELFRYRGGEWRELSGRDLPLGRRIHALASHGGDIYVAGREGLWRLARGAVVPAPVTDVPKAEVEALGVGPEGRLCAGVRRELWCTGADGWLRLWEAPSPITALRPDGEGAWLVGTRDGLFRLGPGTGALPAGLEGREITGLAERRGVLWAATWGQGVFRRRHGRWAGFATGSLSDLAFDPDGRLWLAVYGEGLIGVPARRLEALME